MKTLLEVARNRATRAATWMTILGVCVGGALAQTPTARITSAISSGSRVTLAGSHPPMARAENETGRLAGTTKLEGVTIGFAPSAAQEADLQQLMTAQQTKGSAEYHKWLTPDQFAVRFGMADSDLVKVEAWITSEGMTVTRVARSKNAISFTGTAAQIESAFSTELHTYTVNGESHFAPSADLSIPSAMASSVQAVTRLSNFKPKPHVKIRPLSIQPKFTSSQTGSHYLTPGDIRTIYDINSAYSAGYTGAGQSIAVVGQSFVNTADMTAFQTAANLTAKLPTLVLMPDSGTAEVSTNDEVESDLDLEYSGAIAPGATIYLVYTGSDTNVGAFDALVYAVDEDISPIISSSYGDCETDLGASYYNQYNLALQQAMTQGQTVISASGDDGSTDCYEDTDLTTTQREGLAVDFPASSQYVTGIGGTEFPAADVAVGNTTYWDAQASTDTISSALKYIPEQVWNDDSSADGLGSGGGGVSIYTARPSYQTALTSSISGSNRLVPDVALDASPDNAGYLYCSSDATSTGITGSCSDGFRDANDQYLTVAGGTSFGAPIFAGMLALINQSQNSTGQGLINTTLYEMAAIPTLYASAFHDITSGTNECTAGTTYCSTAGAASYTAGTGYDEASGLGSIDLYNMLTNWSTVTPSAASLLTSTFTTLTAATSTPAASASDVITISVATSSASLTTTSETVSVSVDGSVVNSALALTNGVATYTFSSATAGSHVITATYAGDSVYAPSTGTVTLTVGGTTSSTGTFAVTATSLTVASGSQGNSTVTVTPSGGYLGTVDWTLSSASTLPDVCYAISNVSVTGTTAVTTTLTFYTSSSDCNSNAVGGSGKVKRKIVTTAAKAANTAPAEPYRSVPVTVSVAGLLLLGFFGRRVRGVKLLMAVCALGLVSFAVSGCGSSSSTTSTSTGTQTSGSYTITLVGTDTNTPTITSTTTLTLTIN